jgi:hypothetical protein
VQECINVLNSRRSRSNKGRRSGGVAVATKRWGVFSLMAILWTIAGCNNSGSTFNVQNPPPPAQSNVTIVFQPTPAQTVSVGFTLNFTAVVTNDPNNYGVDWNLVCPASIGPGNCGVLSATHTTSGSPTTYTPPPTLSTASLSGITVEAFATADHTQNVYSPLSVTTFDSILHAGTYVLQADGSQGGNPYQFVAVVTLDGAGNITGGEQTQNSLLQFASVTDSIIPTGSSYFIGDDGRGTITLNDTSFGQEIFSLVVLNDGSQNLQGLVSQTGIDATGAVARGTLSLQTSTAAPTGSYVFVSSGIATQIGHEYPTGLGGIFNIDSNNNVTGLSDEIFGRDFTETGASLCTASPCTVSAPDSFGQVIFNLTPAYIYGYKKVNVQFTGYIVDSSHIVLIESDYAVNPIPFGFTDGLAVAQSAGSANNFASGALSGPYVFELAGQDLSVNNSAFNPTSFTALGVMSADGNGNLSNGFTDNFLLFDTNQGAQNGQQGAQVSASFDGTYTVDSTGRGTLSLADFSPTVKPAFTSPNLIFYLTDNQNPAEALVLQSGPSNYWSLATGVAYPQGNTTSALSGDYGMSLTQVSLGGENDASGQMTANSANTPALSGLADSLLSPPIDLTVSDHSFTGTFTSPQTNGIFTGTFANSTPGFPFTLGNYPTNFSVNYYPIDQDHGFIVETDLVNSVPAANPPNPSGQVSIGYYFTRVPLCSGCP